MIIFRDLCSLGAAFWESLFCSHLGARFSRFWGSFLSVFFDVFFVVFLLKRGSKNCGLDSLFIVYKAHGHF